MEYASSPDDVEQATNGISPRAKLQLAEFFYSLRRVEEAVRTAHEVLRQCETASDALGIGEACFYLERFYRLLNRSDDVEQFADRAIESFCQVPASAGDEVKIRWRLGLVLSVVGFGSWRAGNLARAMSRLSLAEWLLDGTGDFVNIANVQQSLGCIRRSQGDYDGALSLFKEAREQYEEAGHRLHISRVLANEGVAYLEKREWENAKKKLEAAYALSAGIGDASQKSEVLIWLSWLYQQASTELRDLTKAATYAKEAIHIVSESGPNPRSVEARIALGYCRLTEKKYGWAQADFERALEEAEKLETLKLQVNALLSLAELNCAQPVKDLRSAVEHCRKAEKLLTPLRPNVSRHLLDKLERTQKRIERSRSEIFTVTVENLGRGLKEAEEQLQIWALQRAMEMAKGNKSRAAKMLGLSRPGLDKMLKRLFITER